MGIVLIYDLLSLPQVPSLFYGGLRTFSCSIWGNRWLAQGMLWAMHALSRLRYFPHRMQALPWRHWRGYALLTFAPCLSLSVFACLKHFYRSLRSSDLSSALGHRKRLLQISRDSIPIRTCMSFNKLLQCHLINFFLLKGCQLNFLLYWALLCYVLFSNFYSTEQTVRWSLYRTWALVC